MEEAWELAGLDASGKSAHTLDLHAAVPAFIGRVSLHLTEGDIAAATTVGEQMLEMADRIGAAIWSIHHLIPLLGQTYMLARDLEGAQRIGQRLRRDSERMNHMLGLAWADACDALVTWLSGDIEGGSVRLRAAADRLEGIPMVFYAARLRRQLAGRLAELGRTEEALSELRRAHVIFRDLARRARDREDARDVQGIGYSPAPQVVDAGARGSNRQGAGDLTACGCPPFEQGDREGARDLAANRDDASHEHLWEARGELSGRAGGSGARTRVGVGRLVGPSLRVPASIGKVSVKRHHLSVFQDDLVIEA